MSVLTRFGTKRYGIGPYVIKFEFKEQTPPTTTWTERPDLNADRWTKRPDTTPETWTLK